MRRLTPADHGSRIALEPGETIEIRLPQLGGTGYLWSVASSSSVVVVEDRVEMGEGPQPPGAAAVRVLAIQRSGPGPGHLRLVRSRPWESAQQGDSQFEITLTLTGGDNLSP